MSNKNQSGFESESNHNRLRRPFRQCGILRTAIMLGLLGLACRADVIYSNLGSNNISSPQNALVIDGSNPGQSFAQVFTPSQDYILATVTIALSSAPGAGSFTVALMDTDLNADGPGAVLEQFVVTSVPIPVTAVVPRVLNSVAHPTLLAGRGYWLAVIGATSSTLGNWQANVTGDIAAATGASQVYTAPASAGFGGPWAGGQVNGRPRGAFQVSGDLSSSSSTPSINSPLLPDTIPAGSPAFTMTVNGSHFVIGAIVNWSGFDLTTTFVSDVQLTATVPVELVAFIGTNAVTVTNPGSVASNIAYFTTTGLPTVTIGAFSPDSARVGGPAFSLTITGADFTSDATVNFGTSPLTPTSVTSTQILVTIPAALIATVGIRSVSVVQLSGTSNFLPFTISTTSVLAISGLNPSSALAGGDNFTLTVNGSSFTSDAVVHFGTSTLTPSSVTSTQIQVSVPSTLIATAGTTSVTVVQTSGSSNAVTFAITTSTVTLDSFVPGFALAGGPDFTLTITGTNFNSDARVQFGATKLTPVFVTSTQMIVTIPSTLFAAPGSPSVKVVQSSGVSNAMPFAILFLSGQPLAIGTDTVLPAARAGIAYSSSLVASGGTPPYSWTLVNTPLPPALNLSMTGALTGTPITPSQVLLTAKVTDSASASLTKSFFLTITDATPDLTITTADPLPAGTIGLEYSHPLAATGGNPPYVWSILSGTLPAGLSLSGAGLISGTPTDQGTNNFTIQATDKPLGGFTKLFSLTINAAAAVQSRVLSQVASGGGWKTSLYLVNASASVMPVVVNFWAGTGGALSLPLAVTQVGGIQIVTAATVNETIPPNATLLIESDSHSSVAATGWAEVLSTGSVMGFGVFHYASSNGSVSEATLPLDSTFTPSFILPYDGIGGFTAGVALTNLDAAQPTSVTATIWDEGGNQIGTQSINLPAGGHSSFLLTDQLPIATANRGIIEFSADSATNITGFGLRINPAGGLTVIPKLQRP